MEYAVVLRQGEVLSPILFSFFVNDLELYLQNEPNSGLLIDDIVLMLLLFADDMAIFAKSPEELQTNINLLHSYCKTWGLTDNTDKTQIKYSREDSVHKKILCLNNKAMHLVCAPCSHPLSH